MKSYAKIILTMLIWGTLPLFVTNIPYGSGEIVMWRIIFGFLFLAVIFVFTKEKSDNATLKKLLPRLLFTGAVMGVNWVFLFESYRWVDVSIATLAYYMEPVIVVVASIFLFKERLSSFKALGMVAAIAGMFIVTGVDMGGAAPAKGILLALAGAVCYASVVLINKGTKGLSGLETTLIQLAGAAIVIVPYTVITHSGPWLDIMSEAGVYALIVGLVHSGLALFLYFSAIQELPAQSVALCSYIDPASALIFAAVFLGESLSLVQLLGAALILGGAATGELLGGKKAKPPAQN